MGTVVSPRGGGTGTPPYMVLVLVPGAKMPSPLLQPTSSRSLARTTPSISTNTGATSNVYLGGANTHAPPLGDTPGEGNPPIGMIEGTLQMGNPDGDVEPCLWGCGNPIGKVGTPQWGCEEPPHGNDGYFPPDGDDGDNGDPSMGMIRTPPPIRMMRTPPRGFGDPPTRTMGTSQ